MSEPMVTAHNQELVSLAEETFHQYHRYVIDDPDYPVLHLAPPVGRLNDPNGLVYHDGTYHAFYQYSPVHPVRAVFWRHATSTDLTHWTDDQTAVAPTAWYDRNGCYSGSGIVSPEGNLEFFYTGNVKDENGNRETYQNLLVSSDGGKTFKRSAENPLLSGPAQGYTAHFRDPHVFMRDGLWWAILGAQREDLTGAIVYYTSEDRRHWSFGGEIEFSELPLRQFGYMFECPILFSVRDQVTSEMLDVLVFCPQGVNAEGERYNNIFQCGYVVGQLTGNFFDVRTPFTEVDAGFEFYAPQVISGLEQRDSAVLMAWMGNPDQDDQPSWGRHWVHALTYPRELTVRDGKLYQAPVRQLNDALLSVSADCDERGVLKSVAGERTFRLSGTVDVSREPAAITVYDERGAAVVLTVDRDLLIMDRVGTRYTSAGTLRRRSVPASDSHSFDLLIDASTLEIFYDDGAVSFTARTYFHGGVTSVSIAHVESGLSAVQSLEAWALNRTDNNQ